LEYRPEDNENNVPEQEDSRDEPILDEDEDPVTAEEVSVLTVAEAESGWRLDLYLTSHFPQYSRMLVRRAIQSGCVTIDGRGGKPAYRLKPEQSVTFRLPEIPREAPKPENIPLEILYEDPFLAVVNKPADMVVHPSRGHWSGTLVGALAYHFAGTLSTVRGPARPGIVHRLDRDTSGAILIAKDDVTHANLAAQFETRKIHKEYFALSQGSPALDRDWIDQPIGFHPKQREKMVISRNDPQAKPSQTFYETAERFRGFSAIRAYPQTGRTHQIRLHLAHIGCPVLCDRLYGHQAEISLRDIAGNHADANGTDSEILLGRQALHAHRLTFEHPESGKTLEVTAPIPADMAAVLNALRKYRTLV
jgi:23S rRNA pseudouridine1911/1915/1917 synthase